MEIKPHTESCGVVATPHSSERLDEIDRAKILNILALNGYIVFRNYNVGINGFSDLVRKTSSRISLDPARSFKGDTAQKVDAGTDPVGLHCENGNSPFWPDLCWFYCEREPKIGSQTTVCDGASVYESLSEDAQKAITAQNIVYSRRVAENHWKTYALNALLGLDGSKNNIDEIEIDDLLNLAENSPGTAIQLNDDNSIQYRFETPAVRLSSISHSKRLSFANSIFGPSYNYEAPAITFADGSPIEDALLEELKAECDRWARDVGWVAGDIVLIDNTRVMHGRRRIEDQDRVIYNALSYSE